MELSRTGHLEHRGHRVWYGVTGEPGAPRLPLLTVHGGPGIPHDYLEPLASLSDARQVVFYDQYGCGLSDRAPDPAEYDIDLFVDELGRVREELGLERTHLFAHSYGGPLAIEYLLRHPDSGVASFVVSNSFPSLSGLLEGWRRRIDELPAAQARALREDDPGSDGYGEALGEFIQRFIMPGTPPDLLIAAQSAMGGEVYGTMHGSSWFSSDGRWAGWDATSRLGELTLPVLAVSGIADQCVPELSRTIAEGVDDGEVVVLEAAHMPFLERPEEFLPLVAEFLAGAEARD